MFLNHVIQNIYFVEKTTCLENLKFCFLIFGKMYFSLTVSIYSKKWNTLCRNVMFFQAFTTCYETFAEYELYFQTFSIFIPSCIHYDIFIYTRQIFNFFLKMDILLFCVHKVVPIFYSGIYKFSKNEVIKSFLERCMFIIYSNIVFTV